MPEITNADKRSWAALTIAGLLTGLFLLLGFWPENLWWGGNHLLFQSTTAQILFACLLIMAFLPPIWNLLKIIVNALARRTNILKGTIIVLGSLILLTAFRITVHSLGDGYLRDIEIKSGRLFYSTEMLDFFAHAVMHRFISLFGTFRPTTAMATTSILAGVIYVFVMFRRSPFEGWRKYLFTAAVLSLGSSQLFFGYVESYTLVYLFSVWYILLIFQPIDKKTGFIYFTCIYLLAGFSHQMAIILLPSFLYLAWFRFYSHRRRVLILPVLFLLSILPVIVPWLIGQSIGFTDSSDLSYYLLPFQGAPYSVFSISHFFDLANELLLTAPILIIMVPFLKMAFENNPQRSLLISLIGPSLLFLLLFDPKLSMVRDWDLFAVPVSIIVVPLLISIFNRLPIENLIFSRPLTGAILVALIMLGSWVHCNNYTDGHLRRSEFFLDLTDRRQGWGYEVLSIYYHREKDYDNELRLLRKVPHDERSDRYHGRLGQALWAQGTDIGFFRVVEKTEPDNLDGLCKLGGALLKADSLDEARIVFNRVLARDSSQACVYFGFAELFLKLADTASARQFCETGLSYDSLYPGGLDICSDITTIR